MTPRRLAAPVLALLAGALTLYLWPRAARTPEAEVRRLVADCVGSVERRDLGVLGDAIAEDFKGPDGSSKQEVRALIASQALRGQEVVSVFNPTLDVSIDSPESARVEGTFLFARSKAPTVDQLPAGSVASAYRIDASLMKRDGRWSFVRARASRLEWP